MNDQPTPQNQIIQQRQMDRLLQAFAEIPWILSPVEEMLVVDNSVLTDDQRAFLDTLAGHEALKHPTSKYRDHLRFTDYQKRGPDGEWEDHTYEEYRLSISDEYNPLVHALYEAAQPAAEARLNAIMEPVSRLPWQYSQTTSGKYYLWEDELTSDQQAELSALPEDNGIKSRKTRKEWTKDYFPVLHELEQSGRGYMDNRIWVAVDERVNAEIARDAAIASHLPWQFTPQGNMVLDASIIGTLSDQPIDIVAGDLLPEGSPAFAITDLTPQNIVRDILERRGVKLENGQYVLTVPNTVGKLWDSPDGETDRARLEIMEQARETVLRRNSFLTVLPWQFDEDRWAFVVQAGDLTPREEEIVSNALAKQGNQYQLADITNYSWHAYGAREATEEFRQQLMDVVPDIELHDLPELDWEYGHRTLKVKKDAFMQSDFARDTGRSGGFGGLRALMTLGQNKSVIKFETDYDGYIVIRSDNLQEMPYYAALNRALESRYDELVTELADDIAALPWRFGLADNINDYGAVKLLPQDLTSDQQALVDRLMTANQMMDYIGEEYRPRTERVQALLQPAFEQIQPHIIRELAVLPWQLDDAATYLSITEKTPLTAEQQGLLEQYFHKNRWGSYSLGGIDDTKSEVHNILKQVIAARIRHETPVAEITDEIAALPWRYEGRMGRNIVLDDATLTDEQRTMLTTAIPELYKSGGREDAKYELVRPEREDAYYAMRVIMDAPYYEALLPVAEQNLNALIREVAVFPWHPNDEGGYELTLRNLTREQQATLERVPSDFFDYDAQREARDRFSTNQTFILDAAPEDRRLLNAVASQQRQLG